MSAREPSAPTRVSTLELFFDLVFVFTITQLTSVLEEHPNARGVVQAGLMLGVIWWMYGGYAWLTNSVLADRLSRRLLLLGGMACYFVLALTIADAFSGSGTAFGLAYAAVVIVHATLFSRASSQSVVRNILRIAPLNLGAAALILAGGITGGTAQYVLWAAALALECLTPKIVSTGGFEIGPEHFVERHSLVVLIAIGESIVAIGVGAHALAVDLELVAVVVLGLALAACLWWAYFGGDDERAERALRDAPAAERPVLALNGFYYCHIAILFGIVAVAAALHEATGHPFHELETARAVTLAGGVAVFLVGDALFRATLRIGRGRWRLVCAAAAVATIPLGASLAAAAQLTALVALLVGCFAVEELGTGFSRPGRSRAA